MRGPLDRFVLPSLPTNSNGKKPLRSPRTRTDAGNGQRTLETAIGTAPKTHNEFSQNLSRNHGYEKGSIKETVVSLNTLAEPPPLERSSRIVGSYCQILRLIDEWHSEFSSVQKMLDYLGRHKSRSVGSARIYCRTLAAFCRSCGLYPDELVKQTREKIETLVQHYCDMVKDRSMQRGPSSQYPNGVMDRLKCFFSCNGFNRENNSQLRLKGYHQPPRTTNRPEYVPTLKETLIMADRSGSKRDRAIVLTLMCTGLRNSALRALKVGDILRELKEGRKILLVNIEANWNDTRIPGSCKNRIPYYSFIAPIATEAIQSYLEERKSVFGSVSSEEEPLFVSNYNQISPHQRRMKSLTREQLGIIVHKAARAADIPRWKDVRPHTMRKVFESVLRSPLIDGSQMDHQDQVFLMGHIQAGSLEHYYDRTKTEKMRELYSKLVFEDRSSAQASSLETARKIAKLLGVDPSEVRAVKEKELGRQLSSQEEEKALEEAIKLARERQNQEEHKIIQPSELNQHITSGWSAVFQLADGRVVVKRKSTAAP